MFLATKSYHEVTGYDALKSEMLNLCGRPQTYWFEPKYEGICGIIQESQQVAPVYSLHDWIIILAFCLPALGALCMLIYNYLITPAQTIASDILHRFAERGCDYQLWRSYMDRSILLEPKPVEGHTHGLSAAHRTRATDYIRNVILRAGKLPYSIQQSRRDQRDGIDGSRTYHWDKDLSTDYKLDQPTDEHIPYMIDVDYYMDMNKELATWNRPVFLYSFQPSLSSAVEKDYRYRFNENNEVVYEVTGAGGYKHPVWNFQCDTISTFESGLIPKLVIYSIHRRAIDAHHEVIGLFPLASFRGFTALVARYFLKLEKLVYFKPVTSGFVIVTDQQIGSSRISISELGNFMACNIDLSTFEDIMTAAKCLKTSIMYPQVESMLLKAKESTQGAKTLVLLARTVQERLYPAIHKTVTQVTNYKFQNFTEMDEGKPAMVPFMNPLGPPPCVPLGIHSNDLAMVYGRVVSQKTEPKISKLIVKAIEDFARLFVPQHEVHTYVPQDQDYLFDKQDRPTQRHIIDASEFDNPDGKVSSFMKKEPYPKLTHPRVISTIPGATKVRYSCFCYSVAEKLKDCNWYAFGHTPLEIAHLVVDLCRNAKFVTESDGHRWDGHVSQVLRILEETILLRMFPTDYHDSILALHKLQYNQRATTTFGVAYHTGFTRESGSPETSIFNSIGNKFIAFLARIIDNATPEEAFSNPGIYGGDDGLTANIEPHILIQAAEMVGQKFESSRRNPGDVVPFLSRQFSPYVWNGEPTSICDLNRTLRSFNVTVDLKGVTPLEKLLEKSRAYYLTDSNTPFIGKFVSKVQELYGPSALRPNPDLIQIVGWFARETKENQWPNNYDLVEGSLPLPDYMDRHKFDSYVDSCKTVEDLMKIPQCYNLTIDQPKNVDTGDDCDLHPPAMITQEDCDETNIVRVKDRLHHITQCLPKDFKPTKILDFGAGDCNIAKYISKHFNLVVDVYSPEKYTQSPQTNLVTEISGKYDLIIVFQVLHHIKFDQIPSIINILADHLDDKGYLILREHDAISDNIKKNMVSAYPNHKVESFLSRSWTINAMCRRFIKYKTSNYPSNKNPQNIYHVSFTAKKETAEQKTPKLKPANKTNVATSTGMVHIPDNNQAPILPLAEETKADLV
jgi:hypothetical protein